jgi:hypothetical protein
MKIQQVISNKLVFSTSQSAPMAKKPCDIAKLVALKKIENNRVEFNTF